MQHIIGNTLFFTLKVVFAFLQERSNFQCISSKFANMIPHISYQGEIIMN
jgi:hypothetical protein